MERVKRLEMRLSPAEYQLIKDAATKTSMNMSEFIRTTILTGAQAIIEEDAAKYERLMRSTGTLMFSKVQIAKDT